ncbi:sigma-70 family RNA polymerase sigma factor [Thalassoglobus polymorphus]|uniref:RNA polymerase sigma factor FliA n=1 Tax=Thalassoglobus polymorphus TaxID=2527994 RepID=A0A517QPM9_9PLAN|nr:sigma-70 family RNA polymerase sigma factor [Thalassoglobus polymorphus]QDT33572.1 RNA polymerase sigma factor FliA [Thalassoglobus polymorphus]
MDAGLKTYQNINDQQARERLIVSNLYYVKHVIGKLLLELPSAIDFENLEAAGVLGLVEAANRFDADKGVAFKTFAYSRIRGAVLDELRRNCPVPQHILQNWSKIKAAIQGGEQTLNSQQIAEMTDLSVEDVEKCLVAMRMNYPESWSEELLPYTRRSDNSVQEEQSEHEQQHVLAKAIEKLADRPRAVITLYYLDDLTLKQIGQVLGLSESRVSRILTKTELELKQMVHR